MDMMTPPTGPVMHRGPKVFTMGLLAMIFSGCAPAGFVLGLIAMSWGRSDLDRMSAGLIDREGYSLTVAGRIMGIVGAILSAVSLLYWVPFLFIMIAGALSAPR